jgi:hypothetical protein
VKHTSFEVFFNKHLIDGNKVVENAFES